MANGKPGDHPLTDVLGHRLEVYGRETDDLIRKIADLCSPRELDEWWQREIGWSEDRPLALQKARTRYEELLERARQSGWERADDT
jgi:hypothetical protein